MDRVLVTGGRGLLGSRILRALNSDGSTSKVYCGFNRHPAEELQGSTQVRLDVSSPDCIKTIRELGPDVVFHTAAIADVDYCETNRAEAYAVNAIGAKNVALACKEAGAKMVHLSTDYVFNGTKKGGGYLEDDEPNPINYYGRTKLESEKFVSSTLEAFIIARTTVLFGWNNHRHRNSNDGQRNNFATWSIQNLRAGRRIRLVTDQFSTPTFAENLASALIEIAAMDKTGIYNMVGGDCLSRFGFGLRIAGVFGLDSSLISPVTSAELAQTAPRPKNNCLSNKKAAKDLKKTRLLGIDESLLIMKGQEGGN